jgi:outer membrane protein W
MKNFLLYCLVITTIISCYTVQAQDSCTAHTQRDWVIGYETGAQFLMRNNTPVKQPAGTYIFTNSVYGTKSITKHLALEFELKYGSTKVQEKSGDINIVNRGFGKIYNLTVPVTIQYSFGKKTNKVKPFVGTGAVYNVYQEKYSEFNFADGAAKDIITTHTRTPFVCFTVTQGVTYDITPRVQVKESIHFIPRNAHNNVSLLGIDVGVGIKL